MFLVVFWCVCWYNRVVVVYSVLIFTNIHWYFPHIQIFFRYFSDILYSSHIYSQTGLLYIHKFYSEPIFRADIYQYSDFYIFIFTHIQIFLYSHIYSQTGLYLFTTFIQNWFSELIFRDIYQYSDIFISIYSSIFIIVYFSDIQISIYIHNIIHIQNFITSH